MRGQNACDSEISFVRTGRLFDHACMSGVRQESRIMEQHTASAASDGKSALEVCGAELQLDHGNHFRLRAVQDMRLMSVRGVAWITLEREAGETMIRPGEAFIIPSGKTALIGPLHDSVRLELGISLNVTALSPYATFAA